MADDQRRRNLGRGLDALLGETRAASGGGDAGGRGVLTLPIGEVYPGRIQPRMNFAQAEIDELAESIKSLGILQPLIVRPHPSRPGSYEIIAGERRWRAAQQARLHEVPALVRELTDGEALEVALVENLQRENLSPVEEADGYRRLMDEYSHTQDALARMLGKSRSHIANTLRLLQLPSGVKDMLADGRLTAGHARALLAADEPQALAEAIVKRGLSVRQAERRARGGRAPARRRARAPAAKDSNTVALEKEIMGALGMTVTIDFDDPGGRLTVAYKSLDQLDYLVHRLTLGELGSRYPRPQAHSARRAEDEGDVFPTSVDDAIRQMDEGATWDEAEPFEFDNGSIDDDLDKLVADTPLDDPFSDTKKK